MTGAPSVLAFPRPSTNRPYLSTDDRLGDRGVDLLGESARIGTQQYERSEPHDTEKQSGHSNESISRGLSIVVPLYFDQDALAQLFRRCQPILDTQCDGGELVLVDDGSLDQTTTVALALAQNYAHPTTVIRLRRNFGQHPAVFAGLEHSRGAQVVTLDSDLQYPPEEIPKLLNELGPDFSVVSGYRAVRRDPLMRRMITRLLTKWLNARTQTQLRDFGSMFRAYDRSAVDLMIGVTERHRYTPAVIAWLGVPIKEIPVLHQPRSKQGSRYQLMGLVNMMLDLVTGYSIFPLRLLTGVGVLAAACGFCAACAFGTYRVVAGPGFSGTVSAFALIFALLTVLLLHVAMIGEYAGRIYNEAKARPYFVVEAIHHVEGRHHEND